MTDNQIKQELTKRYFYLYENREIILSLFINRVYEFEKNTKKIADLKDIRKSVLKNPKLYSEDFIDLINNLEKSYQKNLNNPIYYLFSNVDKNIISLIEEVIFTDKDIENTILYRYIKELKNSNKYYEDAQNKIYNLKKRYENNQSLKEENPLTVWKLLTYVRKNNLSNNTLLKALDKYFNIDRYIKTEIDWKSGYILLEEDIKENEEFLNNEIYNNSIVIKYGNEYSGIMLKKTNTYEEEDKYYLTEVEEYELKNSNQKKLYQTNFMNILSNIDMIEKKEKEVLLEIIKETNHQKIKKFH